MNKSLKDITNAYDQIENGSDSMNASKRLIGLKESKEADGSLDFKGCKDAYDQVMGIGKPINESKESEPLNENSTHVITDEQKFRMIGAVLTITEDVLKESVNKDNVIEKVSEIRRIMSMI